MYAYNAFLLIAPSEKEQCSASILQGAHCKGKRKKDTGAQNHAQTKKKEVILPIQAPSHIIIHFLRKKKVPLIIAKDFKYHQVILVKISFSVLPSFLLVFPSMTEEREVSKS